MIRIGVYSGVGLLMLAMFGLWVMTWIEVGFAVVEGNHNKVLFGSIFILMQAACVLGGTLIAWQLVNDRD
jgi:hypothetical protein